ncbi:MAG: hypothetical protein QMD10_09550, partial [Desulfitobacteriaceae bacterium]|nr:hypothetical protein [Desulfitobacteriaceae bacterium]
MIAIKLTTSTAHRRTLTVAMAEDSKPKHNRYDNVWEIRREGYPSASELQQRLKNAKANDYVKLGGKARYYCSAEAFVKALLGLNCVRSPGWKALCPRLERLDVGSPHRARLREPGIQLKVR